MEWTEFEALIKTVGELSLVKQRLRQFWSSRREVANSWSKEQKRWRSETCCCGCYCGTTRVDPEADNFRGIDCKQCSTVIVALKILSDRIYCPTITGELSDACSKAGQHLIYDRYEIGIRMI